MLGAGAPSNRLRVAQIGSGRISREHDMPGVLKSRLADYVAVCDVDSRRASDPQSQGTTLPPLNASDPRLLEAKGLSVELPRSDSHHKNWLECVRSRRQPLAPAAVGHRSGSACIVSWIAMKLGRPLAWDARAERFVNDAEANAMLARTEREPYGATRLLRAGKT